MKNLLLIITLILIQAAFIKCSESVNRRHASKTNPEIEKQLKSLLAEKEYFELKKYFETHENEISEEKKLYFEAFIKNAFNQNELSFHYVDSILKTYPSDLDDSAKVELLNLQRDNYVKTFQYANAGKIDQELLSYYRKWKDSLKTADTENFFIIHNGLSNVPVQKVSLPLIDSIKWEKDKIGLMEVPVRKNSIIYQFVFDTRASISVITKTFAKKIGLKILDVSYEENSGITGNKFKSNLGIADSLYLGNILIEHAVFQVVPDSIIDFPQIKFSINGIIGFPVIKELKKIELYQNGRLIVSSHPEKRLLNNLAFDASTTVVCFKTGEDTLSFHFDLGATATILYYNYLEKYKSKILQTALLKTNEVGGAGGTEKREMYILPQFHLYAGNQNVTLDSVAILTKPIYPGQKYYGNIGQDLVGRFRKMTIDFESMYIDFN
ncbi:MAG: retropepsin-like aspartic protease [Ferruginibacter sp.]